MLGTAVTAHWFWRATGSVVGNSSTEVWKPFSVEDSSSIEAAWEGNEQGPVAVEGSRWDVWVDARKKVPAYWNGDELSIRRASWFHSNSGGDGRWVPYEEEVAARMEKEWAAAITSGRWQCKVILEDGDWVMLHSPEVRVTHHQE